MVGQAVAKSVIEKKKRKRGGYRGGSREGCLEKGWGQLSCFSTSFLITLYPFVCLVLGQHKVSKVGALFTKLLAFVTLFCVNTVKF